MRSRFPPGSSSASISISRMPFARQPYVGPIKVATGNPSIRRVTLASLPILAAHARLSRTCRGGAAPGLLARSIPASTTKTSYSHPAFPQSGRLLQTRNFSNTRFTMVAQNIDGTAIAKRIRQKLNEEIAEKQKISPRFKPALTIIQGGLQNNQSGA